ncbi:hypothetical protein EVAR_50412_1 [Eumeta japonica]|uniref:Uncharacterized protein n=1 Tax=Eumeta variegata TaxID=151549 RepID=A0A4C1WU70_EUMVA|nr:hypothetical protein EVAR_50412_1 [Eumeta japonica]
MQACSVIRLYLGGVSPACYHSFQRQNRSRGTSRDVEGRVIYDVVAARCPSPFTHGHFFFYVGYSMCKKLFEGARAGSQPCQHRLRNCLEKSPVCFNLARRALWRPPALYVCAPLAVDDSSTHGGGVSSLAGVYEGTLEKFKLKLSVSSLDSQMKPSTVSPWSPSFILTSQANSADGLRATMTSLLFDVHFLRKSSTKRRATINFTASGNSARCISALKFLTYNTLHALLIVITGGQDPAASGPSVTDRCIKHDSDFPWLHWMYDSKVGQVPHSLRYRRSRSDLGEASRSSSICFS